MGAAIEFIASTIPTMVVLVNPTSSPDTANLDDLSNPTWMRFRSVSPRSSCNAPFNVSEYEIQRSTAAEVVKCVMSDSGRKYVFNRQFTRNTISVSVAHAEGVGVGVQDCDEEWDVDGEGDREDDMERDSDSDRESDRDWENVSGGLREKDWEKEGL